MLNVLDCAYLPSDAVLQRMFDMGWEGIMGYAGPPGRALNIWTPENWDRARKIGFKLGIIWLAPLSTSGDDEQAGVNDGNAMLAAMQSLGFTSLGWLDVENGLILPSYTKGFCDAMHAGSAQVGLYGSSRTIAALQGAPSYDRTWLCDPVVQGQSAPEGQPDWDMIQYAFGPAFDYNFAVNDLPFAA